MGLRKIATLFFLANKYLCYLVFLATQVSYGHRSETKKLNNDKFGSKS